MNLNIKIDPERFTIGDLIDLESGDLKAARNLIATSLTDGDGNYLSEAEAIAVLNKITVGKFNNEVMPAFMQAMEVVRNAAIPPEISKK